MLDHGVFHLWQNGCAEANEALGLVVARNVAGGHTTARLQYPDNRYSTTT
jgi:hypothetical protein